jgi:YggT family protein
MFALTNLFSALAQILDMVLSIYMWLIIGRAILSWVNPDPYNSIVRFLYKVTEPVLGFFRRTFPLVYSGLDLAPLVVLLIIYFLRLYVVQTLFDLARSMGG